MRIGVLSDTHDRLPAIRAALEYFQHTARVGVILHPGDIVAPFAARPLAEFPGQVHVTYGNNDGERRGLKAILPQIQDGPQVLEISGRRILLHHALEWCRADDLSGMDVVLTGHTHEVAVENRDGTLFVNPGECCGWLTGRATVAVVDLEQLAAEIVEVLL